MRGEILKPAGSSETGLILGSDGKRYTYELTQVRSDAVLSVGQSIDFIGLGDQARDIYIVQSAAGPAAPAAVAASPLPEAASAYTPGYMASDTAHAPELSLWGYFVRGLTKHYVMFEGRGRRSEYWGYTLFWWIFLVVAVIFDAIISVMISAGVGEPAFLPIFTALYYLGTFLPNIAIVVRRLHDNGMSGWLILVRLADFIIPFLGTLVIFIITLMDSQKVPNKHGPSPKYGRAQTVADAFA